VQRHLIVLRDTEHGSVQPGDTAVRADGTPLYILGLDQFLRFPEYDNTDPQDGDVWRWGGALNTQVGGQTVTMNVTGPTGPAGGPVGPTGPASLVTGPTGAPLTGPTGPGSIIPGPTGPTGQQGRQSTVPGPTGPTGPFDVLTAALLQQHLNDHDDPHHTTAAQVGADPAGSAVGQVALHNGQYNHALMTAQAATGAAHALQVGTGPHGIGNAALRNVGMTAGTVAAGDDPRFLAVTGATGPVGPPSSEVVIVGVAATVLHAHRAVGFGVAGVREIDALVIGDAGRTVGVSKTAALPGENVSVLTHGPLHDVTFSWTPELPIYAGAGGLLTQSVPVPPLAYAQRVGIALDTQTIQVSVEAAIILG
jgi:hypothetical protein